MLWCFILIRQMGARRCNVTTSFYCVVYFWPFHIRSWPDSLCILSPRILPPVPSSMLRSCYISAKKFTASGVVEFFRRGVNRKLLIFEGLGVVVSDRERRLNKVARFVRGGEHTPEVKLCCKSGGEGVRNTGGGKLSGLSCAAIVALLGSKGTHGGVKCALGCTP